MFIINSVTILLAFHPLNYQFFKMPPKDMEMHNNLIMINAMKEHGTLLWYKTNIDVNDFVTDQPIWKVLSQKTRLKSK